MNLSKKIDEFLLRSFSKLIAAHTGLHIRTIDWPNLAQKIETRCRLLRLPNPESYYNFLSVPSAINQEEWQELIVLLTVGESYFFRDQGQFALLRNHLLPELIERQRSRRTLNIWSAGCSTGEEPYSLAILLTELLPNWQDWNLFILGTDINQTALEKAKQGIYYPWSFRLIDPQVKQRYFTLKKTDLQIHEKIRHLVTFRYENLVGESNYPQGFELPQMDLIVCRNVFVYFSNAAIALALHKLSRTLKPGGYLLTGHTELHGHALNDFQIRMFPESIAYQRRYPNEAEALLRVSFKESRGTDPNQEIFKQSFTPAYASLNSQIAAESVSKNYRKETALPSSIPEISEVALSRLKEAEDLLLHKLYREAIQKALQVLELYPQNFKASELIAQAYANLGDLSQAKVYANAAISINPLSISPYYLLAHIAEEEEDLGTAKQELKKIIYLEPNSIPAYLELAALYTKEGEFVRARKMWGVALDLLKKLPDHATVEKHGQQTAGELVQFVQKNLINNQ